MPPATRRLAFEELGFAAALLVYARWVIGFRRAGTFVWPEVDPERFVRGLAPAPYQYRVLTAWLGRLLLPLAGDARTALGWVEAAAAVALAVAFRAHVTALLGGGEGARRAAMTATPLVAAVLPLHYALLGEVPGLRRYIFFAWDLPAAAAFMVGVALLRARRWRLYYPWFVAATLVKETSCFLTIVHLATGYRREGDRRLALHLAAQGALWVAIKLCLHAAHAGGRGAPFEDMLDDNLLVLRDPGLVARLLGSFGFLWLPAVLWAGRIRDDFTRRALWVLPAWALGMLRVGRLVELRVFGELLAVVLPAWVLLLRERDEGAPAGGERAGG